MKLRAVPSYFDPLRGLYEPLALASLTPSQAHHRHVQPPPHDPARPGPLYDCAGWTSIARQNEVDGKLDTGFSDQCIGPNLGDQELGEHEALMEVSQVLVFPLAAFVLSAGAIAQDQPKAHERTYPTFAVDVPFKFNVGHRAFGAGSYRFIVLGPRIAGFVRPAKETHGGNLVDQANADSCGPGCHQAGLHQRPRKRAAHFNLAGASGPGPGGPGGRSGHPPKSVGGAASVSVGFGDVAAEQRSTSARVAVTSIEDRAACW